MLRVALLVLCAFSCSLQLLAETADAPVRAGDPNPPEPTSNKTTTKSTTTTTTTTTTTSITTTSKTTEAPTTTTTTPTPPPNNDIPKKYVHNNIELRDPAANSTLCFKADFNFAFDVHYNTNDSVTEKTIYLPKLNTSIVSIQGCAKAKNLTVPMKWQWYKRTWSVNLTFAANNETYKLTGVEALFPNDEQIFPGSSDNTSELWFGNSSLTGFRGHLNRTYQCDAEEAVIVQANKFVLKVSKLKMQAFGFKYNDTYNKERDVCSADEPSSTMVPIIVGCVLAGLIVIVIVAYVIATRKFKKYHGYETL